MQWNLSSRCQASTTGNGRKLFQHCNAYLTFAFISKCIEQNNPKTAGGGSRSKIQEEKKTTIFAYSKQQQYMFQKRILAYEIVNILYISIKWHHKPYTYI